jgi:hypothetical protein
MLEKKKNKKTIILPLRVFFKIMFTVEFFKKNLSFRHEKRCMPDMIGVGK